MNSINLTVEDILYIQKIANVYRNVYSQFAAKNGYTLGNGITEYLNDKYFDKNTLSSKELDKYLNTDSIFANNKINKELLFNSIQKWWDDMNTGIMGIQEFALKL